MKWTPREFCKNSQYFSEGGGVGDSLRFNEPANRVKKKFSSNCCLNWLSSELKKLRDCVYSLSVLLLSVKTLFFIAFFGCWFVYCSTRKQQKMIIWKYQSDIRRSCHNNEITALNKKKENIHDRISNGHDSFLSIISLFFCSVVYFTPSNNTSRYNKKEK